METVTAPESSEQAPTPRRPSRRVLLGIVGGLVAVLVAGVALAAVRAGRDSVVPGVTLENDDVGGLTRAQLAATVDRLADAREGEAVVAELRDTRVTAVNADVGFAVDREATVEAVWRRGRQPNPLTALTDNLRAAFATVDAELVERVDDDELARWAQQTADDLAVAPVEGDVRIAGTDVERRDPRAGLRPLPEPLAASARTVALAPGDGAVSVETERIAPETTESDVDRVAGAAERVVSAPVELTRRDETLTIDPETLGSLYTVRRSDSDGTLFLRISRDAVRSEVFDDATLERFTAQPREATVVLTADGPQVREGRNGFEVDVAGATAQIDELARTPADEGRSARLNVELVEPELTTEEARELQITERVSSFTTEHACCQGRVTNIHRFADIVDGALILPGETFSLNGHVGQRTREKGFVAGGAIQRGEYVDEVGGGVSQFATTFFNAAFFGGYEILDHKPHSYYISRYPAGRESTINWPNVDVVIRNDSPFGLLVDTSYTDTSITVTFWGSEWVDVTSTSGEPHNYTSPPVEYEENPELPPGQEQVVQSGGNGFDIVVTRRLAYSDGSTETEEYFTRYLPEPRIIERGPPE